MTDDTIIGGPPSGTEHPPGTGGASADAPPATPAGEDAVDRSVIERGDETTAYHRSRLYALLALGFDRPGDDLEAALAEGFVDEVEASAAALDDDLADVAATVGEHVESTDALHGRWASLFGVEEGVTVSPYELTYLPGPLMTNVRRLADVRGFYEAWGLSVAEGHNDRGDHVCFLAEFMSHLCEREAALRIDGDDEGVAIAVDAQQQFIEDHLGRWYWRFADEVSSHDRGFYAALADLLAAFVEGEIDRLGVDPEWVPDDPEVTEWNEDVFGDSGRGCGGCGLSGAELHHGQGE